MAENKLYTFYITQTTGTFTIGDEINIFYDDVADDIVVKNDTTEIFTGPVLNPSEFYPQNFNYQFCDSTTLVSFSLVATYGIPFPYAQKVETENSPSCTGNTCDLVINSNITTPDNGTTNGTITVNASSSASIEYGLANFRYGQGQSSNVFTELASGTYTVYAKDANGCSTTLQAEIKFEATYGTRFRCEFDNIKNETQVLIQQISYTGSVTDVCISTDFSINYPSKNYDSFLTYVIWPSVMELELLNETDQQFISLYSEQHKRFRAIVSRGGSEVWRGFLQPNTFSEPNDPPPYFTRFTFIDGLIILQNILVKDLNFDGSNSLFDYIYVMLSEVGLQLPIHVAVNVYSQGMNSSFSMLTQAYLRSKTFERDEELTAYEAIEWMLLPFGCTLTQFNGAWWIVRHDQRGNTFTYHIFDEDGTYTGTDTYNGVIALACPTTAGGRIVNQNRDAVLDRMPSFGQIILQDNFDIKESLVSNYDFSKLNDVSSSGFSNWSFVLNGATNVSCGNEKTPLGNSLVITSALNDDNNQRDCYIQSTGFTLRYKPGDRFRFRVKFAFSNFPSTVPFAIIKCAIKFGDKYLENDLITWSSSFTTFRIYLEYDGDFKEHSFEFRGPSSGVVTETAQIFIYNANVYVPEYDDTENINAIATVDLPVGYKVDKMNALYAVSWPTTLGTPYAYRAQYYELIVGNDGDVTPLDYNASTNDKNWRLVDEASIFGRSQPGEVSKFYIDEVEIDYLPEGDEPIEEQETPFILDDENPETLDVELNVGGLPFDYNLGTEITVNDIYNYDSQYIGLLTTFFNQWGRSGLNEALRLQKLFVNTLIEQHKDSTWRLSGTFSPRELGLVSSPGTPIDVAPLSCVYDSYSEKYYIVVGYTAFDTEGNYRLEMVELKTGTSQTEFDAFSDGFSDGFS